MTSPETFRCVLALVFIAACGGGGEPGDSGAGDATMTDSAMVECTDTGSDALDPEGIDSNCDGVDGIATDSIFVDALTGSDTNAGTRTAPVATIHRGLELAASQTKHSVLVSKGIYLEQVTLVDGISIYGGFDAAANWAREARISDVLTATITAPTSPAVIAATITSVTVIDSVKIVAPTFTNDSQSSIGLLIRDSTGLVLEHVDVVAGNAGAGTPGAVRAKAASGNPGGTGGNTLCSGGNCGAVPSPMSGAGGTPAAGASCGGGGNGGPVGALGNNSSAGTNGWLIDANTLACRLSVKGFLGGGDPGGGSGMWNPSNSNGGIGSLGVAGVPGGAGTAGVVSANSYTAQGYSPAGGGDGTNGRTGGGGGGGSPNDAPISCGTFGSGIAVLYGPGAGGGGSGGAGGQGGQAGQGGGASIAIYVWNSVLTMRGSVVAGIGGAGGSGSDGGLGGDGGAQGPAGTAISCPAGSQFANTTLTRSSGRGGEGASGGKGGAGGGGAGGPSFALFLGTGATVDASSEIFSQGGGGGAAGPGGAPANGAAAGIACLRYTLSAAECIPLP